MTVRELIAVLSALPSQDLPVVMEHDTCGCLAGHPSVDLVTEGETEGSYHGDGSPGPMKAVILAEAPFVS